ncbi:MAG: winged helix DNA-binding domain-containing protein [Vicinamibacterales bacterium]
MNLTIAERRLRNQHITGRGLRRAADVVAWLGAVQAQEYEPARWGLGLRMQAGAVAGEIQRAFDEGQILRTHVMRPTWQFVLPSDIRWLLELTAPRVHRILSYYNRALELDARTLTRGAAVIERALRDGHHLTRAELAARLQRAALPHEGERLARVVMHAELEGVICSGPRRLRQFTYALVAERAPKAARLPRDEALATLAQRFFCSHAPATIRDFVWWSGLTTVDAKRAIEMIRARREEIDGLMYWTTGQPGRGAMRDHLVHLLPIFDEYLVAYRDREAVPHPPSAIASASNAPVAFQHAFVIAGHVAGTWRITRSTKGVTIHAVPLRRLNSTERRELIAAARRYQQFVEVPVEAVIS